MEEPKVILEKQRFGLTIDRLCHQLVESFTSSMSFCLIGIQERGAVFSDRIKERIHQLYPESDFSYGKLDISFYRDDFRTREKPLKVSSTEMDFLVEGLHVVLIDDVLYTGRTVHSAMAALMDFGRPASIRYMTLVDRRFNRHFPIKADYSGITVDAVDEAYVKVEWSHLNGEDRILLFSAKMDRNR
ncbi:MAG TPA: bifunctional pyr operon transcriptional regulator/uracil phosphoribosyltransferase PyrR [Saprospiraceae bacterium]|nr:bifunctional pyr operon transcriptional regulator/uracil phosphoribosyltransferase PyrR [Saprospiraceae bacterium]